jgi:hypothetical protein
VPTALAGIFTYTPLGELKKAPIKARETVRVPIVLVLQPDNVQWCWAAVAVCIHNYWTMYDGTSTWNQCELVGGMLSQPCCVDPVPDSCNKTGKVDKALTHLGNPFASDGKLTAPALKKRLMAEGKRTPIAALTTPPSGPHAVVLCGYKTYWNRPLHVRVGDPLYGITWFSFPEFEGEGWTHSYVTAPVS